MLTMAEGQLKPQNADYSEHDENSRRYNPYNRRYQFRRSLLQYLARLIDRFAAHPHRTARLVAGIAVIRHGFR